MTKEQAASRAFTCRTKLLHKYLPPMEVEVAAELGGTVEQRILIVNIRCLTDSLSLMVVDHKGRVSYASTQLATMLGYPVKALSGMTLAAIVPPPFSQLHASWMKDLAAKPMAASCRAGGVVHLLSANGARLPVTLQISAHDDGEHVKHIVKVCLFLRAVRACVLCVLCGLRTLPTLTHPHTQSVCLSCLSVRLSVSLSLSLTHTHTLSIIIQKYK